MQRGKQIRLFYTTGQHNGVIRAELLNWTGYVYSAPRSAIYLLAQKPDALRAGVYFLLSRSDEAEERYRVYVGETANGIARMSDHDEKKDFWDTVILVQCKDTTLTKTHCSYLEYRLYQIITQETIYDTENARALRDYTGELSDADISDMETFIDNLRFVLPALGCQVLTPIASKPIVDAVGSPAPVEAEFTLNSSDGVVSATAYIRDGIFTVRAGSRGRLTFQQSVYDSIRKNRATLIEKGKIIEHPDSDSVELIADVSFTSTSTPATMLMGSPVSGPFYWKVLGQTTVSYKDWESSKSIDFSN